MSEEIVYKCNCCGEGFSLEGGKTFFDRDSGCFTLCPNCKSGDIEEAKRCKVCREIHYEWEMKGNVCTDCFNDAVSAWKALIEDLQPWQKEALEDEYGNLDITEE